MAHPERLVYLDNAATTPVRDDVRDVMMPYLSGTFGNPSSAHRWGREAKRGVENARRQVAAALDCEPRDVVFTSGGTEADNLAIIGSALASQSVRGAFRVAVTALEHPAVLAAADEVVRRGGEAIILPVDRAGRVDPEAAREAVDRGVAVLSAMWVNNEVGTVQDVDFLSELCRTKAVAFHTDAVQAVGKIPVAVRTLRCSLLSISGHKIGALVVKDPGALQALTHGGGQQSGVRPGTENTAGIVGLGAAVHWAVSELDANRTHFATLQQRFEAGIRSAFPDALIAGAEGTRAPHVTNVLIPGIDTDAALMHLDLHGVACSTGSACKTGSVEPSKVLLAMGIPADLARCSLRFSYYKQTTESDIDYALGILGTVVEKVRRSA